MVRNRRFGTKCQSHIQGSCISWPLKIEPTISSETSFSNRLTLRHNLEDGRTPGRHYPSATLPYTERILWRASNRYGSKHRSADVITLWKMSLVYKRTVGTLALETTHALVFIYCLCFVKLQCLKTGYGKWVFLNFIFEWAAQSEVYSKFCFVSKKINRWKTPNLCVTSTTYRHRTPLGWFCCCTVFNTPIF